MVDAQAVSSCFPAQIILNLPMSTHIREFFSSNLWTFSHFPLCSDFCFWVTWTEGALRFHDWTLLFSQISCLTKNLPFLWQKKRNQRDHNHSMMKWLLKQQTNGTKWKVETLWTHWWQETFYSLAFQTKTDGCFAEIHMKNSSERSSTEWTNATDHNGFLCQLLPNYLIFTVLTLLWSSWLY